MFWVLSLNYTQRKLTWGQSHYISAAVVETVAKVEHQLQSRADLGSSPSPAALCSKLIPNKLFNISELELLLL